MLPFLASSLRPITRRALVDLSTAGVAGAAGIATPARAFEIPLPSFGADPEKTARLQRELKAAPVDPEVRACGSRMVGTYTDPMHPGCTRRVAQIAGTKFASIRGADEDGIPWVAGANVACADYNGVGKEQLIVDFTAKGGPKDVVAVADYSETSCKLTFPDGNVWTMVPCSSPNLKTKQQVAACEAAAKG